MTLKTLLLGSAAAFAVVGGAQAADLSVAEPVESVKVCETFGAGYWYIPGSDTCLKIGGYVQFDVNAHDSTGVTYSGTHSATWDFVTETSLQVTAQSMTDFGALKAFIDYRAHSNNATYAGGGGGSASDSVGMLTYLDSGYLQIGALLAGRTGSVYDYGGGWDFAGSNYDSDQGADQLRLSWAAAGFGLALGIEDPRDRFGSSLDTSYTMPNIVGAITASQANWDGQLSAAYGETQYGTGFAVQAAATLKLDSIAAGDKLRLKGAWAESEIASYGSSAISAFAGGSVWSALIAFQHFWSSNLSSNVTFDYYSVDNGSADYSQWEAFGNLVWSPVTNFSAGVEVGFTDAVSTSSADGAWSGKVRLVRSW